MKTTTNLDIFFPGVVFVDKPSGITSNALLQKVKRLLGYKKAGHTGSLDPLATGMLPVCLGEATKFSQYLLNADKVYRVTAKLGVETTTGDVDGEIIGAVAIPSLELAHIHQVMQKFIGEMMQTPPAYSALKHEGKPLYAYARAGVSVDLDNKKRPITVYNLSDVNFNGQELSFTAHVSKGTYIRSLVVDIAKALGTKACVAALHRLAVGKFNADKMSTLAALEQNPEASAWTVPLSEMLENFPKVCLNSRQVKRLYQGQPVIISKLILPLGYVQLENEDQKFLGLGEYVAGWVKPKRLVAAIQK